MTTATATITDARVIAAWNAYLEDTKAAHPLRYTEVETWAWARLQQKLRRIDMQGR